MTLKMSNCTSLGSMCFAVIIWIDLLLLLSLDGLRRRDGSLKGRLEPLSQGDGEIGMETEDVLIKNQICHGAGQSV